MSAKTLALSPEAITTWIEEWIRDMLPGYASFEELLKQGYCADLATCLWEAFGGPPDHVLIWHSCENPCHVWLEYQGRHYDMQNPRGVDNWRQMEYFKDCHQAVLDS